MTFVTVNKPVVTPKLPEITLQGKGKLILTKELQDQIDYSHSKVGNIEWCGVLFYEKVDGDITDPKSLVLCAHRFYMMDIGSHSYTAAEYTADVVMDMFSTIPDAEDMVRGLIH